MSRIRSLKPEWLDDEPLGECSDAARVLSVALIITSDDHGNGRLGRKFALRVWPDAPDKLEPAFEELVKIRFARAYEVDGQRYYSIRNWHKHQRIDNAGKPRVPLPPKEWGNSEHPSVEEEKKKSSQSKGAAEVRGNSPRNSARPVDSTLDRGRGPDRGRAAKDGESLERIPASEFEPPPELVNLAAELGLSSENCDKTLNQYQTKTRSKKIYDDHCRDYEKFLRSTATIIKKSAKDDGDGDDDIGLRAEIGLYRKHKALGNLEEAERWRKLAIEAGLNPEEN